MPPKVPPDQQALDMDIQALEKQLEAEKSNLEKSKAANKILRTERDELETKLFELQAKQADNNAALSKLERELNLGSTSPLDWDRGKKGDLVERVVNAFRARGGTDASLKAAHEALIREHQRLVNEVKQPAEFEADYHRIMTFLETMGLSRNATSNEACLFIREATTVAAKKSIASEAGAGAAHVTKNGTRIEVHLHVHE